MYTKHFNFKEKPFNLTPDPKFLYLSPGHQEALASMIYGIKEKRGFISIIGEIGIGKTTLLHTLFKELGDEIKTVFIFNTKITFTELLQNILIELNLTPAGDNKTALISQLNDYLIARLAENETVAIIIDEAQNLSSEVLEELRMLSNLETPKEKLLQIVLVGQPELDFILRSQNLRQLKQRIAINCYLTALNREDQMKYIAHRMTIAGHKGNQVFTPGALELICKHSRGIPRLINIFCDNALLTAYGKELSRVDADVMQEIIYDYEQSKIRPAGDKAPPIRERRERKTSIVKSILLTFLILLNLLLAFLLGLNFTNTPGSFKQFVNAVAAKVKSFGPVKTQPSDKLKPSVTQQQAVQIPPPRKEEKTAPAMDTILPENESEGAGMTPEQIVPAEQPLPPPPVEPAALPLALPEQPHKAISAKPGDIISSLATKEYGTLTDTIFDMIKRANPSIKDLNLIYIGDKVILPPLDIQSMIIQEDDGTFSIHLATFPADTDGRKLQTAFSNNTYKVSLRPVQILGSQTWQRVTLGNFPDRTTAIDYFKAVDVRSELLPFPADTIHQSLKSMRSTY
jgi:general secretion pathway protein A